MYIKSISHYIPEGRVSNNEILAEIKKDNESKFDFEQLDEILYGCERKFEFLGVETRSACRDFSKENIVTMAVNASKEALKKANLKPEDIDCVIVAGVTNPFREPSFSILLSNQLGINQGDFFDINDTCNGFLKAIDLACLYLESGRCKTVLTVSSESPDEVAKAVKVNNEFENEENVDQKFSSFFVGAGAAAAVISSSPGADDIRIVNYAETRESKNWDASMVTFPNINIPASKAGNFSKGFWTDARFVSSEIIKKMPEFVLKQMEDWNLSTEDIDVYVVHQLGNNVTFATLSKIDVPNSKAPVNTFNEYGNLASANIPVNLSKAISENKINKGDSVMLLSSACGLTYSLLHLEW